MKKILRMKSFSENKWWWRGCLRARGRNREEEMKGTWSDRMRREQDRTPREGGGGSWEARLQQRRLTDTRPRRCCGCQASSPSSEQQCTIHPDCEQTNAPVQGHKMTGREYTERHEHTHTGIRWGRKLYKGISCERYLWIKRQVRHLFFDSATGKKR